MPIQRPLPALVTVSRALLLQVLLWGTLAQAASDNAKIISIVPQKNASPVVKPGVVALLNMDEVLPDCQQQIAVAKVKTVAYSESGITPEKISVDWQGARLEIATNVGENPVLTLEEIYAAHQFIKVGKRYLIHFQSCGEGRIYSLINMYTEQVALARQVRKVHT